MLLDVSGVRLLWMLRGISAVLLMTELCYFCNCAPALHRAKYWQKFQAALSDVATTSIRGSQQHHLIDLEVLAVKISVDVQAVADSVTMPHGRQHAVECMVLVWEAGELPDGVKQGTASSLYKGGAYRTIDNGMIETVDCPDYVKTLPPADKIGSLGWPCDRGAGVSFTAIAQQSGKALDGMVFYQPKSARDYSELDQQIRHPRYKKAVDHCIGQEKLKEEVHVSRFAVCVKNYYPDLGRYNTKEFYQLRANVAFTNFKRHGVDRDTGFASIPGGVWIDCTPDEPEEGESVEPVSLCHAAMFSCQERSRYNNMG